MLQDVTALILIASNSRNRTIQTEQLKKETQDLSKQYTKTHNINREKFWSIQTHSLHDAENSNMWNAWKKCSEKVEEKAPALKKAPLHVPIT